MANQALWRVDAKQAKGLDATVAYNWSPANINRNNTMLTAGLRFNEPLPVRIHNTMSVGYVRNQLSQKFVPQGTPPWKTEHGLNSTRCWTSHRCFCYSRSFSITQRGGKNAEGGSFRIQNQGGVLGNGDAMKTIVVLILAT